MKTDLDVFAVRIVLIRRKLPAPLALLASYFLLLHRIGTLVLDLASGAYPANGGDSYASVEADEAPYFRVVRGPDGVERAGIVRVPPYSEL